MKILGMEFDNPFTLFLIFILLLGATGYLDPAPNNEEKTPEEQSESEKSSRDRSSLRRSGKRKTLGQGPLRILLPGTNAASRVHSPPVFYGKVMPLRSLSRHPIFR